MKSRLTYTGKWRERYLKSLPVEYKLFWLYLNDECDNAGVWPVEIEIAAARIGVELDETRALELFGNRILVFANGEKWLIREFMKSQYTKNGASDLNRENSAVKNAIFCFKSHGLTEDNLIMNTDIHTSGSTSGQPQVDLTKEEEKNKEVFKDKEKNKDQDKDKDKKKDIPDSLKTLRIKNASGGISPQSENSDKEVSPYFDLSGLSDEEIEKMPF